MGLVLEEGSSAWTVTAGHGPWGLTPLRLVVRVVASESEVSRLAAYRSDVILRDTAVVGLVGGAGLGWQLMEALSSFYWPLVAWLVMVYAALTLLGELVCERLQEAA